MPDPVTTFSSEGAGIHSHIAQADDTLSICLISEVPQKQVGHHHFIWIRSGGWWSDYNYADLGNTYRTLEETLENNYALASIDSSFVYKLLLQPGYMNTTKPFNICISTQFR